MRTILAALVLIMPLLIVQPSAASACTADHVWFLGAVHDDAQREDFQKDVDNFEFFLEELRDVYCIPDSQAEILAFESSYTRAGETYEEATEANVKSYLSSFGSAASDHDDSLFFFFLSSHGLMYPVPGATYPAPCGLLSPRIGSFSALADGGGQDGSFHDCELGRALNTDFDSNVEMFVAVDCSFCGGFSDSLTAASGTIEDDTLTVSSGVPAPGRVVITGCAITTECFGGDDGAVLYGHMAEALSSPSAFCDGWTAPGFPDVQGFDVPVRQGLLHGIDGECSASEWFFGSVWLAYASLDVIGIQEQFRIKYGFSGISDDIRIN